VPHEAAFQMRTIDQHNLDSMTLAIVSMLHGEGR
jgi:hypothetical protein